MHHSVNIFSLYIYLSIYLSMCLLVYHSVNIYPSVYTPTKTSNSSALLSPSVSLCMLISIYLCICLLVHLSVNIRPAAYTTKMSSTSATTSVCVC